MAKASNTTPAGDTKVMPATASERIAQFCEWFDLEPPKVRARKGVPIMNDALWEWFEKSGASIDWIVSGDVKCMAGAYRRDHQKQREFQKVLPSLEEGEKLALLFTMRMVLEHKLNFDDSMAAFKAAVDEHRAEKQTA